MKKLILFARENAANPHGSFEDITLSDKIFRIIYHRENLSGLSFFIFKRKIKKLLTDSEIILNDFSLKIPGTKIRCGGHSLVMHHLSALINIVAPGSGVVVFSSSPSHIPQLSPLIMSCKDISFLTSPSAVDEFSGILLKEFGISGGAVLSADVNEKIVIIMPGGENFSPEGAKKIINLSKSCIPWQSINPENVSFKVPAAFKGVTHHIRHADILETVLNFFDIDFSDTRPISVKFNKHKDLKY